MAEVFRAKVNTAVERAEDARELLDYSDTLERDLLGKVRRGIADAATARKRTGARQEELRKSAKRLKQQVEEMPAAGNEELARETSSRRARVLEKVDELGGQQADLRAEEERLTAAAERLQVKVDAFAHWKETFKVGYTLTKAETYVNETVTGISEEIADVELATRRAQDETAHIHARAVALEEMLESGTLPDALSGTPSGALPAELQARLDEAAASAEVEEELRAMRARPSE